MPDLGDKLTCVATWLTMALLLAAAAVAIYPDDLWDHSTKITKANVDTVIADTISAGKTLFVRFIASTG